MSRLITLILFFILIAFLFTRRMVAVARNLRVTNEEILHTETRKATNSLGYLADEKDRAFVLFQQSMVRESLLLLSQKRRHAN